jgi:hypothetical protein
MMKLTNPCLMAMLLISTTFCASAQDITTGLIQHYPFTNGTKDESNHSPNANAFPAHYSRDMHGYVEGSPALVGNSYYLDFPDSVRLGTPGWTYSIWFKLNVMPVEVCDGDAFLLTYKNVVTFDDVHLFVDDEDNAVKVYFKTGAFKITTGVTIQRGVWYHAVLRYTATTTDVFMNGNFAVSSAGRFVNTPSYTPLVISSVISYPVNKGRIFGNIDDIRMYKRVLTNADINFLYNTERNLVAPAPVKDTIRIRDTIIKRDTIILHDTVRVHDTTRITVLDTIILGGNCIIRPNPVSRSERLYIQTNDRPITVVIYTVGGQLVKKEVLTTQDFITLTNLPAGTYYIKIVSPTGTCGRKIIVY